MEIRKITENSQREAAINLIWETFLQFDAPDYSAEGVQAFEQFIRCRETVSALTFFGAYQNDQLRGALAMREDGGHICCFFVQAQSHRQGIGRSLWEHVLRSSPHSAFTVNSSPYAVPFYHKLGFQDTAQEQLSDGIRFTPMRFERHNEPKKP